MFVCCYILSVFIIFDFSVFSLFWLSIPVIKFLKSNVFIFIDVTSFLAYLITDCAVAQHCVVAQHCSSSEWLK